VAVGDELLVDDPGRALLELPLPEPREVSVRADDHVLAAQPLEHLLHLVEPRRAELFVELDLEAERRGERLDGLDAAQVRARDDQVDPELGERFDEAVGLEPSPFVHGPDAVVSLPGVPVAGASVADQEQAQTSSSTGSESSTTRSRSHVRKCAASSKSTQRTSSTPSPAIGSSSPYGSSIAQ